MRSTRTACHPHHHNNELAAQQLGSGVVDGWLAVKSGLCGKYIQNAGGLSQAFGLYRHVVRCLNGRLETSQDRLSVLDVCGLQFATGN